MNSGLKGFSLNTKSRIQRSFGQRVKSGFRGQSANITVIGLDSIRSISVPNGTPFTKINFSDYYLDRVKVAFSNGTIKEYPINWISGTYNGNVSATYTVYGLLSLPGYVANISEYRPTISITVATLETEFQTVLTHATSQGYTLPSPINQGDINTLIAGDKADGTFATRDIYYIMMTDGDSSFARLNYKDPTTNQLAQTGTITYTSRKGFTGDGSTGFFNTGLNTSTSTNFQQNNCGFGCYIYSNDGTGQVLGSVATGARITLINGSRSTTVEVTGNTNPSFTDDWHAGYYHVYRSAAGSINCAKNSVLHLSATADNSVAEPNANLYLLARNNAGTADVFSTATISCFWAGANLGASAAAIFGRWHTYLLACRVKNDYSNPSTVGIKVNDTFARASLGTAYATTGSASWTLDGSKMTASGSVGGFGDRMLYKYGQSAENVVIEGHFKNNSVPSASTRGLGAIFSDYAGLNGERSVVCQLSFATDANGGKCLLWYWDGTTPTQVASSSTAFTIAQNDEFDWTFEKTIESGLVKYTFTATRTVGGAQTVTVTYSNLIGDSSGDIGLITFGGSADITLLRITFNDKTKQKLYITGNSLSHGAFAGVLDRRFASQLYPSSYEVDAGSGDTTADVVGSSTTITGKIRSALDHYAQYYALIIGGNDVAGGVSSATWQSNLKKLYYAIKNEGHRVIWFTPPARSGGDMNDLTIFYEANFTDTIIETLYTTSKASGGTGLKAEFDSSDAVHMNDHGHITCGKAAADALPPLY